MASSLLGSQWEEPGLHNKGHHPESKEELVGQTLGETYRVDAMIGQGGMGAVYRASHLRVPRKVAIKTLLPEALGNAEVFARFRREAEIASSLGHDNIAQVFDFNQTPAGVPFMVIERLEGEDLEARLARRGPLSIEETLELLVQVSSALTVAHEEGIVHRDLKPANLFICTRRSGPERVKILDFGISKLSASSTMATRTGSIMATPNYMSPEQADGRIGDIDSRTDVFALSCILFRCLAGRLAFEGPTVMATLFQIVHGEPLSLATLRPDLPPALVRVIESGLQKELSKRTPTAAELCREFQDSLHESEADQQLAPVAPTRPAQPALTTMRGASMELPAQAVREGGWQETSITAGAGVDVIDPWSTGAWLESQFCPQGARSTS